MSKKNPRYKGEGIIRAGWDDYEKRALSGDECAELLNQLTDQLEDTLAELRNAKSAREIQRDHMEYAINKLKARVKELEAELKDKKEK